MNKSIDDLVFKIKSGYSYFYAESKEVKRTCEVIEAGLTEYFAENKNGLEYKIKKWEFETTTDTGESVYNNPDDMFQMLENVQYGSDSVETGTIILAPCFNWFLSDDYGNCDKAKVSWLLNRSQKFSSPEFRKVLIIVGEADFNKAIPEIIKRDFAHIEFDLPSEKEIEGIYNFIVDSAKQNQKFVMPTEKEKKRIIAGARGLTYAEIVKVFSYSIVKNKGVFDPLTVEELRSDEINSTPGLSIRNYDKKLDDLKGFEIAKELVDEWIDDPESKGIILLGPAGVGKTHFCQSLAGHYKRLIVELEFAGLMGQGLVGQAEAAMKKALDVIAANANPAAPIIVFVDEIEKGLAGTSSAGSGGGANDGGTTERSNAQFLKFLSDARPKGIYFVASCNDIERLPSAFVRAERWDCAPIFVDLPNNEEQEEILAHYKNVYGLDKKLRPKDMNGWSGAEIKTWCKLAKKKIEKGKPVTEADELIVPVSKTMAREIDYLRKWKDGRTVPASRPKTIKQAKASGRKLDL